METFREFFTRKRLEYMTEIQDPEITNAEYAEHLTNLLRQTPENELWNLQNHVFSAVSVHRWSTGQNHPVEDNLWGLIAVFRDELCDILGIPRIMPRDPDLRRLVSLWLDSSEAKKREVMEFAELHLAKKITPKVTP